MKTRINPSLIGAIVLGLVGIACVVLAIVGFCV